MIVVAVVACTRTEPGEMLPINPGGGGVPGGLSQPDARADTGDASGDIAGRVCVVGDARYPPGCTVPGAGGLTVTLGTATTTTLVDGTFTIARPPGTGLVWHISGTGIEPAAIQFGGSTMLPALESLAYGEMLAATSAVVVGGDGALIARLVPVVTGATATSAAADSAIYYDGATAVDWTQNGTGAAGAVWIPSMAAGARDVTVNAKISTGIPIYANTITFAQLPSQ